MKDRLAWEYMVTILSGQKYSEEDSDGFARNVVNFSGEVKETTKHNSKNEKR